MNGYIVSDISVPVNSIRQVVLKYLDTLLELWIDMPKSRKNSISNCPKIAFLDISKTLFE